MSDDPGWVADYSASVIEAKLANDAPVPVQAEAVAEAGNVLPFRRPTPWPHAWKSPNKWHGSGWNAGKTWQGAPRVLITNRSAKPPGDDEPPPRAA